MKSRGEKAIELIKTINWQVGFDFHRQGSALPWLVSIFQDIVMDPRDWTRQTVAFL